MESEKKWFYSSALFYKFYVIYKPGNGGVKIREFTFVFPLSLSNQAVEEKINIFIIVINPNTKNPKSGNKSFLFRIPG